MKFRKTRLYKYVLEEDFSMPLCFDCYSINVNEEYYAIENGTLTIRKGYRWDGATCAIDTKSTIFASLVHDCLYQMIRTGRLPWSFRKDADKQFYELLIEKKCFTIRAKWCYLAVRVFGGLVNAYATITQNDSIKNI